MTANTLSAALEQVCMTYADRPAMIDASGTQVSFANFFFTMIAFAESLQDRGIGAHNEVAVEVPDAIAGTALRLALLRIGATVLPPGYPDAPLRLVAGQGDGSGVIGVDNSWIRSPRRLVPITAGGLLVKATSGTTGLPKYRLSTDETLLARVKIGLARRWVPQGPGLNGYNPGSSTGLQNLLRIMMSGQQQCFWQATPAGTLAEMVRTGARWAYLPPLQYLRLLEVAESGSASAPTGMDCILVGGGALSPERASAGERLFGATIFNTYGSGETGSVSMFRPSLRPDGLGVVGPVTPPYRYRFVRADGSPAPDAEGGELWLWVPEPLRILDYPSRAPIADAEGWVETGDLGHITPDGDLCLTGRKSDLLNFGGDKRAPAAFEALASGFPGVAQVVALGVPAKDGTDRLGLAVVPADGFDPDALRAHMVARIGPLYPVLVRRISAIPHSAAGKVDRKALRLLFLTDPSL